MREIIVGAILTPLVGGIGVLIWKFVLDPVLDFKRIKREILNKLALYSSLFCNYIEYSNDDFWLNEADKQEFEKNKIKYELAQNDLKKIAADLITFPSTTSFYNLLSKIKILPTVSDLNEARGKIISISNRMLIHGKVASKEININILNSECADDVSNLLCNFRNKK